MTKKFLITTAIDYPNGLPHIGTSFEKIGADVQARYQRMNGKDVLFLIGNDENTIKVFRKARADLIPCQEYCDKMAVNFQDIWGKLNISYDKFVQTSHSDHHTKCADFLNLVNENGYIYKDKYTGYYCDECESFKTKKDLDDNLFCTIHKKMVSLRIEPCYYFKLSAFKDQLLQFYAENPTFLEPETRKAEVIATIKKDLLDVNITRYQSEWGIPLPWDKDFRIYVWFDALLSYITGSDCEFPADIQFIGKDITRFHGTLYPAMLLAANAELPKKIFAHGFVNVKNSIGELEKLAKSSNNLDINEVIDLHGTEAFRYYLMKECPFNGDGEFSLQRFTDCYNSDLANNLGNLYSRVVSLFSKNFSSIDIGFTSVENPQGFFNLDIKEDVENFKYHVVLQKIVEKVLNPANAYLEKEAPWKIIKVDPQRAVKSVGFGVEALRVASIALKPFIPDSAQKIYESFSFEKPWKDVGYNFGHHLSKIDLWRKHGILFPKSNTKHSDIPF